MKIVEAIQSAATQHAVYFLVTAYVESLRHFERTSGVPPAALALPIAGASDLEQRLDALRDTAGVPREAMVAVSELAAVITCALGRLEALACAAQPESRAMAHVRNDSRRSALSV
jgi:hypothetical protein